MTADVVIDKLVLRLGGVGSIDAVNVARLVAEGLVAAEAWPNRASLDRVLVASDRLRGGNADELAAGIVAAVLSELERVG